MPSNPPTPVRSPRGGIRRACDRLIDLVAPPMVSNRRRAAESAYQHAAQRAQLRLDIRARHRLPSVTERRAAVSRSEGLKQDPPYFHLGSPPKGPENGAHGVPWGDLPRFYLNSGRFLGDSERG